jgi:hypothetical protein
MSVPCQQNDRIEHIEIAVDNMTGQVTTLVTDFAVLKKSVETALTTVGEHDRALRGYNGDMGLVAQVIQLTAIFTDLNGALRGTGKEPGLISSIDGLAKKINDWEDSKKWITRLVVGWFITALLGLVVIALK